MKLEHQAIIDRFARLSDGDRSCVVAMLKMPSSSQLTSRGSLHDQFYQTLESQGWSQAAELDPALAAFGLLSAWQLTDVGRRQFPALLAAAEITRHSAAYESRLPRKFAWLAFKFACGYVLVQALAVLAAYGVTRLGFDIAPLEDYLFVVLLLGSCYAGVMAAVTPWNIRRAPAGWLGSVGSLEAILANYRLLCACFALPVFAFHLAADQMILRFDAVQAARLLGTPLTRSAVMTVLVCALCWTWLPSAIGARISRSFERR